jgi:hypothetical protein
VLGCVSYTAQAVLVHHQVPEEVLNGVDSHVRELLVENTVFPNLLQAPNVIGQCRRVMLLVHWKM